MPTKIISSFNLAICVLFLFALLSSANAADYVPGQIIIKTKPGRSIGNIMAGQAKGDWEIRSTTAITQSANLNKLKNLPTKSARAKRLSEIRNKIGMERVFLLQLDENADVATISDQLNNIEGVEYAHPNIYLKPMGITQPNDPLFEQQYSLHNTGQTGGIHDADIDAPEAWRINQGNSSIVVAIADEGVDINHPDLMSNIWLNPSPGTSTEDSYCYLGSDGNNHCAIADNNGWNFCDHQAAPRTHYEYQLGNQTVLIPTSHGSMVAGIVAASSNNDEGISGVSPNTKIMPLQIICNTTDNSSGLPVGIVAPISDVYAAIEYASLNNASIINSSWGGFSDRWSASDVQLLQDAFQIAEDMDVLSVTAAGNSGVDIDVTPVFPGGFSHASILNVAFTDHADSIHAKSNYGAIGVDMAAPGSFILSTIVDGGYYAKSGTSFAAPHVSAAAAMIRGMDPSLTSVEVKNLLMNTVDLKPNYDGLLVSPGRLNLVRALAQVNSEAKIIDYWKNPQTNLITVFGYKLTTVTSATIGGTPVGFGAVNDDLLSILVPAGVTGAICLTSNAGTVCADRDYGSPLPAHVSIAGFNIVNNTYVTLFGTGFHGAGTTVSFNGTQAVPVPGESTIMFALIPDGVTAGQICVSNTNGQACSAQDFIPQ